MKGRGRKFWWKSTPGGLLQGLIENHGSKRKKIRKCGTHFCLHTGTLLSFICIIYEYDRGYRIILVVLALIHAYIVCLYFRISKKETNRNQSQFNSISTAKSAIQPPQSDLLVNSRKPTFQPSQSGQNSEKSGFGPLKLDPSVNSGKPANSQQQFVAFLDPGKLDMRPQQLGSFTHLGRPTEQTRVALFSEPRKAATQPQQQTNTTNSDYHHQQPSQSFVESMRASNMERMYSGHQAYIQSNNYQAHNDKYPNTYGTRGLSDRTYNRQPLTSTNHFPPRSPPPLTSTNHFPPMSLPRRQGHMQQQLCRYYAQGRCHFGDSCKFLHERRREYGQRREDRWPCDQRNLGRWPEKFWNVAYQHILNSNNTSSNPDGVWWKFT